MRPSVRVSWIQRNNLAPLHSKWFKLCLLEQHFSSDKLEALDCAVKGCFCSMRERAVGFELTPSITNLLLLFLSFFCYLLFIVVVAAAVFSNHQQWVQPSFSPSVLSTSLPFKVSLTLIHSTACSPTIFISTSCSIQTQISLIYQLNDLLCGFICPVPIPHLSVCMFSLLSQALPSHPFHACSPSHADVRWSTPVQQHAAVNCLHRLLPDRPGLWTVHLWYWQAHKYMDPRYKLNVPRLSVM